MGSWLLAIELSGWQMAMDQPQRGNGATATLSKACEALSVLPARIEGRILGSRLREGMTVDEADRKLGRRPCVEAGTFRGGIQCYPQLGIWVGYRWNGSEYVVTHVSYFPFFSD